jgi:hypothetical protein
VRQKLVRRRLAFDSFLISVLSTSVWRLVRPRPTVIAQPVAGEAQAIHYVHDRVGVLTVVLIVWIVLVELEFLFVWPTAREIESLTALKR